MQFRWENELITYFFLYGCIFSMGFFFLLVFIIKKEVASLYFTFACFLIPVRSLLLNSSFSQLFFSGLSRENRSKFLYCLTYLILMSLYSILYRSLKEGFNKLVYYGIISIHLIFILLAIFTDPVTVRYTIYAHLLSLVAAICYAVLIGRRIALAHKELCFLLPGILLGGLFSVFSCVIYYAAPDGLDFLELYGFYFFLIAQLYVFVKKYVWLEKSNHLLTDKLANQSIEFGKLKKEKFISLTENLHKVKSQFHISRREMEIIYLILMDQTNKEIAEQLYISYFTVRRHLDNIYHKFDINNRKALIKLLMSNN